MFLKKLNVQLYNPRHDANPLHACFNSPKASEHFGAQTARNGFLLAIKCEFQKQSSGARKSSAVLHIA